MGINRRLGTILYADDSQVEQELFKQALKEIQLSCAVKFFANGGEIIEFLEELETKEEFFDIPSIILLDWQMPVKSGLETLKTLKEHPEWKTIPVLIFSSHDDPIIIRTAYEAHANAYIKKPLDYDDLPRILRSIDNFWIKNVKLAYKNIDL